VADPDNRVNYPGDNDAVEQVNIPEDADDEAG
jgi:hypothetical protein